MGLDDKDENGTAETASRTSPFVVSPSAWLRTGLSNRERALRRSFGELRTGLRANGEKGLFRSNDISAFGGQTRRSAPTGPVNPCRGEPLCSPSFPGSPRGPRATHRVAATANTPLDTT